LVALGFAGVLSFSIGGTFVLYVLITTLQGHGPTGAGLPLFSFLGFLLVGLGLFMLIQDGKMTIETTHS
jgi:hypothetical protein